MKSIWIVIVVTVLTAGAIFAEPAMPDHVGYCVTVTDANGVTLGRVDVPFHNAKKAGLEATRQSVKNAVTQFGGATARLDVAGAGNRVIFEGEPVPPDLDYTYCICATLTCDPTVCTGSLCGGACGNCFKCYSRPRHHK